jgi:hypothetical protein
MRWRYLAAALGVGVALTGTPTASAEWYFTRHGAQHIVRSWLKYERGYYTTSVICRPQGLDRPDPAYKYHRWVCSWAAGGESRADPIDCGTDLIVGSHGRGSYYRTVLHRHYGC